MTGLRTKWGVDTDVLRSYEAAGFGAQQLAVLEDYVDRGWAKRDNSKYMLTIDGLLQVDTLTANLFVAS